MQEVDVCAYGHHFYGCAKTVKKEICHPVPVKEEISKDVELCKLQPKKVRQRIRINRSGLPVY